jgi:hypothetical protein
MSNRARTDAPHPNTSIGDLEISDLRADVLLETCWQRHEPVESAKFSDEQSARAWMSNKLERLRIVGQVLGGDDAAWYVAELRHPNGTILCNAYLFGGELPLEWDELEAEDSLRGAPPTELRLAQRRHPSALPRHRHKR